VKYIHQNECTSFWWSTFFFSVLFILFFNIADIVRLDNILIFYNTTKTSKQSKYFCHVWIQEAGAKRVDIQTRKAVISVSIKFVY